MDTSFGNPTSAPVTFMDPLLSREKHSFFTVSSSFPVLWYVPLMSFKLAHNTGAGMSIPIAVAINHLIDHYLRKCPLLANFVIVGSVDIAAADVLR